jgi:hypothetical protein
MWLVLLILATAQETSPFTSPASDAPEYGHRLSAEEAGAGWLALFDGASTFGWTNGVAEHGILTEGSTTTSFGPAHLKGAAARAGIMRVGMRSFDVAAGDFDFKLTPDKPTPIKLESGLAIKSLSLKPSSLNPAFNGRDLTNWTILRHKQLPDERQTKWSAADRGIRSIGGPGALELDGCYGDFVLQAEVRMLAPLSNGGIFFRSIPGDFMNGYEAQLFNGCYDRDPAKPARYSTGAIDDRRLARRLVSRDNEPFTMTVIAVGPHIATWVNGGQMTDWTDIREKRENPREGLRTEPGTIQLQAHDGATQIEYRHIRIAELK